MGKIIQVWTNPMDNGDYQVKFTIPEDYVVTVKDAGGDDTKDSDPDSDGTVNVTIKDDDDFTIDLGIYTPKASIGDFVWDDVNRNGIQDENELGVANIEVILLDRNGNEVSRTKTDENGKYLFTDLKIGDYQVEFNLSTIPNDYIVTSQNVGDDDAKDSDANQTNGKTEVTTLEDGENDLSWDMGIHKIPKYSLGDYVWVDTDRDGLQDENESGVPNVKVELFDSNGDLIATTKTDENGKYIFKDLINGTYQVIFTVPDNYIVTTQNAGKDDIKDSDATPSGNVRDIKIQDANDFTIDMGIYRKVVVDVIKTEPPAPKIPEIDLWKTFLIRLLRNWPDFGKGKGPWFPSFGFQGGLNIYFGEGYYFIYQTKGETGLFID